MKDLDKGSENADWKFQVPDPGTYIVVIGEGIVTKTNEDSGAESLHVPTKVLDDEDFEGASIGIFLPTEHQLGEKRMADILHSTGWAKKFEKNFPGNDVGMFDLKVIEMYKKKLPGSVMEIDITHRKQKGKDGTEKTFINIDAIRKKGLKPPTAKSNSKPAGKGKADKSTESDEPITTEVIDDPDEW